MPTKSFVRQGGYKGATTIAAAMASGASAGDVKWALEHGYMAFHPPPEGRVPGPLPGDGGEAEYGARLMARLVLPPKIGDLSLCKNWRRICLVDVTSKFFSSAFVAHGARDRKALLWRSSGLSVLPGGDRRAVLFTAFVERSKRKEIGLRWALQADRSRGRC
jgi:hypothetical protein